MASELEAAFQTGRTVYFLLRSAVGQIWNGAAFENYAAGNYATYPITGTEQGASGLYAGDMPAAVAGTYNLVACLQAGGSPAQGDTAIGTGGIQWSGTAVVAIPISSNLNLKADIEEIAGNTGGAARLDRTARAIVTGTVGSASTTTSIVTSALSPAAGVTDQFKGRIVIFDKDTTTANLRGQATDITGSTSGGVLTVSTLTTAPVSGDTFTIT